VLALYAVRLGLHPGGRPDPLLLARRYDFPPEPVQRHRAGAAVHRPLVRHRRVDGRCDQDGLLRAEHPVLGVRPLPDRVFDLAAVVPVPHLASRRPRGGPDFKKLVAYSSVSHMGYVTLGLAAMNLSTSPQYYAYGVNGAMFMMLAHGI